jgi:hypothetical protein
LYQPFGTIVAVSHKRSLRALAFNQIGRLLSMRDPTVLYAFHSVFVRFLSQDQVFLRRSDSDSASHQRYKSQIDFGFDMYAFSA